MQFYFLEGAAPAANQPDILSSLMPMILILGVFYFLIIMPQRKKDKKNKEMLSALKVGDEIVTIGGIYGKIVRIKDETFFIESTNDKTKVLIARWAVKEVTKQTEIEE